MRRARGALGMHPPPLSPLMACVGCSLDVLCSTLFRPECEMNISFRARWLLKMGTPLALIYTVGRWEHSRWWADAVRVFRFCF